MTQTAKILIVGAGLQGSCIALALAHTGLAVTVIDQDEAPMNRASRRNEGKIHLGLIYAAAPNLDTASCQLRGAMSFAPLLSQWIGPTFNAVPISTPFDYLVANDSFLSPGQLAEHYEKLSVLARDITRENPQANYLSRQLTFMARPRPDSKHHPRYNSDLVQAVFETEELAIDTDALSDVVIAALNRHPNITFLGHHQVASIERRGNGFCIEGQTASSIGNREAFRFDADVLINATWENRFALDTNLGFAPTPGWLHRLKYRVMAKLPASMAQAPSTTMVIGRYGDVVVRPDRTAYLSWYPSGLRGWTDDLAPPKSWGPACRGETAAQEREFATSVIEQIAQWYPAVADAEAYHVDAGAIVAYGRSDVDQPASDLHDRTQIGVFQRNGYFSVDPGKLTTAPMFAEQACRAICEQVGAISPT